MSSLLYRFRQQYPQGSLRCDLLDIDRGLYLVQASVTVDGIVLGTALAAQGTLEGAEDSARERVLAMLNLSPSASVVETSPPAPPQTHPPVSEPHLSPPPLPPVAIAKPQSIVPPAPSLTVEPEPPPQPAPKMPVPPPAPPVESSPPAINFPAPPVTEPELPFTLQSEIYDSPDTVALDPDPLQNGTQAPLPVDANSLRTDTPVTIEAPLFDQPDSPPTVTTPLGLEEPAEAIDFSEIIARSNLELKRLGWTSDQGRDYLLQTYGKRSRQLLSDEQLIEFLAYLEQQPTPE